VAVSASFAYYLVPAVAVHEPGTMDHGEDLIWYCAKSVLATLKSPRFARLDHEKSSTLFKDITQEQLPRIVIATLPTKLPTFKMPHLWRLVSLEAGVIMVVREFDPVLEAPATTGFYNSNASKAETGRFSFHSNR
jgi:hypothetical protein